MMNDPIQNGIGDSLLPDNLIPFTERDLGGNDQGAFAMLIFHRFHQCCAALSVQRL